MDSNLDDQLNFFDFHSEKKIMLVYVKASKFGLKPTEEKDLFMSPIIKEILESASFAGVLSSEDQKFIDGKSPNNSYFFFVFYDKFNKLQKTGDFKLDSKTLKQTLEDLQA